MEMESQFLNHCVSLANLLVSMKQKGTFSVNIGDFNFNFSNEAEKVKKYSPSQQRRNTERKHTFEIKKQFENDALIRRTCVDSETQTSDFNTTDAAVGNETFEMKKQFENDALIRRTSVDSVTQTSDFDTSDAAIVSVEPDGEPAESDDETGSEFSDIVDGLPFLSEDTKQTIYERKVVLENAVKENDKDLFEESERLGRMIKILIKEDEANYFGFIRGSKSKIRSSRKSSSNGRS